MSERIETHTITGQGVTLPLLIWRIVGGPAPGLVERAFDLNPGLAAMGSEIPVGTAVRVGLPVADEAGPVAPVIDLWS